MNRGLWDASLILIILGMISLGAGAVVSFFDKRKDLWHVRVMGRVVDLVLEEGDGPFRNKVHPVVEYYADGKLFKKQLETGAYPSRWEIGQKIPLIYDPSSPERIREDDRGLTRYVPALLWAAGILMLLGGIYLFIRFALRG